MIESSSTTRLTSRKKWLRSKTDLYQWSFQLQPFVGSQLVADCFALARDLRSLDMRAAPYDLSALGIEPVWVETPAGRANFVAAQRDFAARAAALRARLVHVCDRILADSLAPGATG